MIDRMIDGLQDAWEFAVFLSGVLVTMFFGFMIIVSIGALIVVATGYDSKKVTEAKIERCHEMGGEVLYDSTMYFDGCRVKAPE